MFQTLLPNHPVFVHFPLALLSAAFLLELLGLLNRRDGLHDAGRACLFLGTAGALCAVGTGLWGQGLVEPRPRALDALIERHQTWAFVTVALSVVLTMWRISMRKRYRGEDRIMFVAALGGLAAVTLLTGHLGGQLVYDHGAAVTVGKRTFGAPPLPRESWPRGDSVEVAAPK